MDELSDVDVELVKDLIDRSELASIEFHEVSAKRFDGVAESSEIGNGHVNLGFECRSDAKGFGIRIVSVVAVALGEVKVVVAADYKLHSGAQVPERVVEIFANSVAVIALYPYVREGVASISSKVFGKPITLPLAGRGQIRFEAEHTAL